MCLGVPGKVVRLEPSAVDMPMGGIMKVSAVIGLLFYAPYPIILIVCFRKPNIVAAMDQQ